jgi:hypothetical protein
MVQYMQTWKINSPYVEGFNEVRTVEKKARQQDQK